MWAIHTGTGNRNQVAHDACGCQIALSLPTVKTTRPVYQFLNSLVTADMCTLLTVATGIEDRCLSVSPVRPSLSAPICDQTQSYDYGAVHIRYASLSFRSTEFPQQLIGSYDWIWLWIGAFKCLHIRVQFYVFGNRCGHFSILKLLALDLGSVAERHTY